MFSKLLAIIFSFGVIGCALLVNRQQQIEAAHEMSTIHRRLSEQERIIWELRAQISQRISPEKLQRAREQLVADWQPIVLHQWPVSWTTWAGAPDSEAPADVESVDSHQEPGG